MSFRRMNDRLAKLNSKSFGTFRGSHYGFGKCDQPDPFAYICDFHVRNEKLELRDGKRKNSVTGYPKTVTAVMRIELGGNKLLGVVVNGILNVYTIEDVRSAVRKYYTWSEVEGEFIWKDLFDGKTWNELFGG